jgi:hypothetical protein
VAEDMTASEKRAVATAARSSLGKQYWHEIIW